jgi:two-component system chemotaxis response regulator CheY
MIPTGFEGLKALIVEDNMHMRALLRELLHCVGIKDIAEASDGGAAIEQMRLGKPDLVLTDLTMAPIDGLELVRHVRMHEDSPNPFLPVIMVTGHTERQRVEAARDAGVTEFLAKPVTAHKLFSRIAEIVERPRAFVRCDSYFGPDRRRRQLENYAGPWRRAGDRQEVDAP